MIVFSGGWGWDVDPGGGKADKAGWKWAWNVDWRSWIGVEV